LNKLWFQSFLILVSSVVCPYAVIEYGTPEFAHVQVWIFSFGVYIYEWEFDRWIRFGQFVPFWSTPISLISIIALEIGLILAAEVISIKENTELTRKVFCYNIFLFSLHVILIVGLGLSLFGWDIIFPLPIPFLITILLLKYRGITIIPFKNLRRHHQNQSVIQDQEK
jgi:hypothetical protein